MENPMLTRFSMLIGSLMILLSGYLFLGEQPHALSAPEPALPNIHHTAQTSAQTATVQFGGVLGFTYSPSEVHISPGGSVEWLGDFAMHPLVSDDALWQVVNTGTQFSHTFDQPGVYPYHCQVHGTFGMVGTVIVGYTAYLPLIER
jgi:plastocyanin